MVSSPHQRSSCLHLLPAQAHCRPHQGPASTPHPVQTSRMLSTPALFLGPLISVLFWISLFHSPRAHCAMFWYFVSSCETQALSAISYMNFQ